MLLPRLVLVDSGCPPDLLGGQPLVRLGCQRSLVGGPADTDPLGHGTRCVVAFLQALARRPPAAETDAPSRGARPLVQLDTVRIFDDRGATTRAVLTRALRGLLSSPPRWVALPCGTVLGDRPLRAAVRDLVEAGTTVLAAAGNPSAGPDRAMLPARWPGVVCVGVEGDAARYRRWRRRPDRVVDAPDCSTGVLVAAAEDILTFAGVSLR